MKNQYFGDTRDLFKYDLVVELLLETELRRFTFIPMLTRNEETLHGGKTDYGLAKAGKERLFLTRFLQDCVKNGRRDIAELEKLFRDTRLAGFELLIHGKTWYFTDKVRERYFSSIGDEELMRSIIVVDPDNGLEVKSMGNRGEKYIKYAEVGELYRRMDKDSVLIAFQFIPRVERSEYFSRICGRIRREVADSPVQFVSDSQVVFFLLTKNEATHRAVRKAVTSYADYYGLTAGEH